MRNIWLLPDYTQSGNIIALEGEKSEPIYEVIDLNLLPRSLVLGIPEEVLENNPEDVFVYSQYCKIKEKYDIFASSIRAGKDRTGRSVVITNIQILETGECPKVPPLENLHVKPDIVKLMNILKLSFENKSNPSVIRTLEMLDAVKTRVRLATFSSEPLIRTANPPEWMPKKKEYSSILKISLFFILIAFVFIVLVDVMGSV